MKKTSRTIRVSLLFAGSFAFVALLLSACKKSTDFDSNTPVSALMTFNLAPDKTAIGIAISGNVLTTTPLNYTSYTGIYQTIFPGSREVTAYDFGGGNTFATVSQNFEATKYYSAFVLGANGTYSNLVVKDELDSLSATSGQAYVRFINAIPDSTKPLVTLTANGTDLSNSNAGYATVSSFTAVNPGDVTIKVDNGTTISANRTITVEKGKVYTILLTGIPGSTEPAKIVQIKYITNGSVS